MDDALANRTYWDREADQYQADHRSQLTKETMGWGVWDIPESQLGVLGDVGGADVLELGCGAAQWSIKLARLGARPIGMDNSRGQLRHAAAQMAEAGVVIPLVQARAEALPFAEASFDLVFCDHGAMSFADPRRTVPEAARVMRAGGVLAFNMASPFLFLTWDPETDRVSDRLHHSYFELGRFAWEEGIVEYQLSYGQWIRLFRESGLVVEDLVELQPPEDATTTYVEFAPLELARRWPAEHIWKVRKPG